MALAVPDQNTFFEDLMRLMHSDGFRNFYNKHMGSSLDFKTSLVYIELYQQIETIYRHYTGKEISPDDMQVLLRECMRRKEYRAPLVRLVKEYTEDRVTREHLESQMVGVLAQRSNDFSHLLNDDASSNPNPMLSDKADKM